jgi:gas vesicle protein
MFKYFSRYKQIQRQKQVRKIFFFSTISAIIAATFGALFSSKENRDKLVDGVKQASQKIKHDSEKAYNQGSQKFKEIKDKVSSKLKEDREKGIELEIEEPK